MELEKNEYDGTNARVLKITECDCGMEIPKNKGWQSHWLNECPLNPANQGDTDG